MPAPAILTAAARVAAVAIRTGAAVGAATVRAARVSALYSLRLAQRAATAAQRMARSVWRRLSSNMRALISKGRARIASAWTRIINYARRLRATLPQILRRRLAKTFEQLYDIYDLGSEALNKQRMTRRIVNQLKEAVLDPAQFNRRMEDLARLFDTDEESLRQIRREALMLRYKQTIAQLAEDYESLMSIAETPDEEEGMRDLIQQRFFKEAAPVLLAARIAETGDPTVVEDIDSQALVYEAMMEFMTAVQETYDAAGNIAEAIEGLEGEVEQAISRASFRQMLAASAARIMSERNIDNFLFWHVAAPMREQNVASVVSEAREDIEALGAGRVAPSSFLSRAAERTRALTEAFQIADDYFISSASNALKGAVKQRLIGVFDYSKISQALKRVGDFFARLFGRKDIPTPQAPTTDAPEYVEPERQEEPTAGEDGEDDGLDEDDAYAIWKLGDRRKHCWDCIGLSELTALFPVPVYMLPTPGTETACGELCGCSVEIVDREEYIHYSRLQWEMQPGRINVADIFDKVKSRFSFNPQFYKKYIAPIEHRISPVEEDLMSVLRETAFQAPNVVGWEEIEIDF